MTSLTLISHHLCPYVQRAAIALLEKGAPFERVMIDLDAKPDWFLELSPLGKVPLLRVSRGGEPDASPTKPDPALAGHGCRRCTQGAFKPRRTHADAMVSMWR